MSTSAAPAPALPDRPKRKRTGLIAAIIGVVVVAIIIAIVLGVRGGSTEAEGEATGASTATAAGKPKTVTIGVADEALPYWKTYRTLAKDELNVDVKLVNFADYSLPNPALAQEQIDINQFQHIQYLANYNLTADDDLQPIGATAVYPLPLYSTTAKAPEDFEEGATIAVPNDAVNEARALLTLQAAKLLTLKDGGNAFSTSADIETQKVDVVPVDASQTANALQSGSAAGAIVNNNFATAAGLPSSDVVFDVDPSGKESSPYVNLFVTRKADVGNKTYLDLAQLFEDPAVQATFAQDYPDAVASKSSAEDLQAELAQVEKDGKAAAKTS